jgi:3-oxoacyl-[acyl-carrier protein] reductase
MRRHTPLRSIGEPEDIAAAVLYLASDAARFMTGQVLRPNGGVAMV